MHREYCVCPGGCADQPDEPPAGTGPVVGFTARSAFVTVLAGDLAAPPFRTLQQVLAALQKL